MKRKPLVINLKRPRAAYGQSNGYLSAGPPAERTASMDPESPTAAAYAMFGKRLEIYNQSFFLDRRPISLDDLMVKLNTLRKAAGIPQVGRKKEWKV